MNILVLEDDDLTRIGLVALLRSMIPHNLKIYEYADSRTCLSQVQSLDIDLALVDLDLEDKLVGFEVVQAIADQVYTVVLTGHEEEELITQGYELGAKDFIVKPIEEQTLEAILHRYKIEGLIKEENQEFALPKDLLEKLQGYSFTKQPILITGETGTGKSHLAENIHHFFETQSEKSIPYIKLNCNELNESLVEAELFGYVKGAFTGADKDKDGLLSLANGGVLFLDEIGSINEVVQKKLLTALETKSYFQVGGTKELQIDFILISATCENLEKKVENGEFRIDLYQRLKGIEIESTPFRNLTYSERNTILNRVLKTQKRKIIITPDAREILLNLAWEGNIRELIRYVEKVVSSGLGIVDKNQVLEQQRARRVRLKSNESGKREEVFSSLIPLVQKEGLPQVIEDLQEYMIQHFYRSNDSKARETIKKLKISNNQFYKFIKK